MNEQTAALLTDAAHTDAQGSAHLASGSQDKLWSGINSLIPSLLLLMLIGRDRAISRYQKVNNSKSSGYLENKLGL